MATYKPIPVKIDTTREQYELARKILGIDSLDSVVANAISQISRSPLITNLDIASFTATQALHSALIDVLHNPKDRNIRILFPSRIDNNTCSRFLEAYTNKLESSEWPTGVEIRTFPDPEGHQENKPIMHAKMLSAYTPNGSVHLFGSCNFSSAGLERNVEVATILADPPGGTTGSNMRASFEYAWEASLPLSYDTACQKIAETNISGRPIEEFFDYQEQCIRELWSKVKHDLENPVEKNRKGHIIWLPTAAGKTIIAVELVLRHLISKCKVIWLSHLDELLVQAKETFARQIRANNALISNLRMDFLSSKMSEDIFWDNDVIFSPDRMLSNYIKDVDHRHIIKQYDKEKNYDNRIVFIVDEAHRFHTRATQYMICKEYFNPSSIIGLTATPAVLRSQFRNIWNKDNVPSSIRNTDDYNRFEKELEKKKILSKVEGERVDTGYAFVLNTSRNIPPEMQLANRVYEFDNKEVNNIVVNTFKKNKRKKTLIFAVKIEHASRIVNLFRKSGVEKVVEYHSGVPIGRDKPYTKQERQQIINEFRKKDGKYDVLVSVYLASQGLDIPAIECIYMVRPTFSELLYAQMLGRGRRGPKMYGTDHCKIYDFTYSFIDEYGKRLDIWQRTLGTRLDYISDEDMYSRLYLGTDIKKWTCPICEIEQEVYAKNINVKTIKYIKSCDMANELEDKARIYHLPAHVVFYRGEAERECIEIDDLAEYIEKEVIPRKISELPGNRIRIKYIKI